MSHTKILDLTIKGVSKEEIEAHFNLLPERYFINTSAQEVELHLRMVNQLLTQIQDAISVETLAPVIDWRDDHDLDLTVVNLVTWDRAGLFFKLAGALTLAGVSIHSTRAISRTDNITIDTFYIMGADGGIVSNSKAQAIFQSYIEASLIHGKDLTKEIKDLKGKPNSILPPGFRPQIEVYNALSRNRTILEVQAGDRTGLLFSISYLIYSLGFDITFARIATERGVAMDTFYIEKIKKEEPIDANDLLELRDQLNTLING
jgi:[protein-PII] uridylyltransferase